MAAAVADAAPIAPSDSKIKKADYQSISLQENPDLLKSIKSLKQSQVVVAFAAETANNSQEVAREKMVAKGADLIYLNDVSNGAIFGEDFTAGSIIESNSIVEINPAVRKIALAHTLINKALDKFNQLGYANV
jgi:phosphopantothenoylcysteine decarboxylase/phosphopantothenate--cysteine ligase